MLNYIAIVSLDVNLLFKITLTNTSFLLSYATLKCICMCSCVSVCVCMCVRKFVLGLYMCTLLLTFSPNCRGN